MTKAFSPARLGRESKPGPLNLAVPVEAHSTDVVTVDEHRAELIVAEVRHIEAK